VPEIIAQITQNVSLGIPEITSIVGAIGVAIITFVNQLNEAKKRHVDVVANGVKAHATVANQQAFDSKYEEFKTLLLSRFDKTEQDIVMIAEAVAELRDRLSDKTKPVEDDDEE
jgi:ClpP class serine protease